MQGFGEAHVRVRRREGTYEEHISGLPSIHARPLDPSDLRDEPVQTLGDLLH
jgi:hypothetical protein